MASKALALGVRDLSPTVTRRSKVSLVSGQSIYMGSSMLDGLRPEASQVSFSAGSLAGLNVVGLLSSLNHYPYGCTEQLTSVALSLVYLNEVAVAAGLASDDALRGRVNKALIGILSNQASNGAFGVWRPNDDGRSLWLDAYVTDFLTRACEADYDVPDLAYTQALDNLANSLPYASDFDDGGEDVAYALYVLTRAGRASIGDIRYFIDTKLGNFATPFAKTQLGAAAALYGEQRGARTAFAAAISALATQSGKSVLYRSDYGSHLRDVAGVLALATDFGKVGVDLDALRSRVAEAASSRARLSTQDKVWMLLAADALLKGDKISGLTLDGNPLTTPASALVEGTTLMNAVLQVSNTGKDPVELATTVTGPALVPVVSRRAGASP
ncbi:hypothetical protein [Breoghania sp.]|uniref:hypothetical protein n=1 Tax=Breoghania sp. TaxID=2065378 RepID=UPI00261B4497|nr:hypothetical protein [Breoghania sp.]MDJ0932248.1 hypothetical protein [Breoghania sp.]